VAASRFTELNSFANDAGTPQQLFHLGCQFNLGGCMGFQALAQSRTGRSNTKTRYMCEEDVTPKDLYEI
jgi:hypothetical protein